MKIRGIVRRTYSGSASLSPTQPVWTLPLVLEPWRDASGALRSGAVTVWQHATTAELEDRRRSAPKEGAIVEVTVEGPERVVGLDRPAGERDLAFVAWAPAVDAELVVFAEREVERLATAVDPVLGTFVRDESGGYTAQRRAEGHGYELVVVPVDPETVVEDLATVRADVAWLEANAGAIRRQIADLLWDDWQAHWRQPDEQLDRSAFEEALSIAGATMDVPEGTFVIDLDDGDLFGGHWLHARVEERRVVDVQSSG